MLMALTLFPADAACLSSLFFRDSMSSQRPQNPTIAPLLNGTAPQPVRLAAARGILPLPQADLLEVLVALADGKDSELASTASATIVSQDTTSIETLVRADQLSSTVLGHLVKRPAMPKSLYEALIGNRSTPAESIVDFAKSTSSGALLEFVALNQQLLVQMPLLIDAIVSNPNRTPDAERRALETKREFFEKELGAAQIANELRAQGKDAAAEFIEKAEFASSIGSSDMSEEDALFIASHIEVPDRETDDSWLALEYIEEIYEETAAERKAAFEKILGELQGEEGGFVAERVSMLNRIMKMNVKDRMRLAQKGDREARNILIRDPNRLVAHGVANNPRITEQEVEAIASMRTVTEDILRGIATNRQWMRSYNILHNLVKNPRTPIGNAMSLMNRMQIRDLIAISKNRNVSDAVRRHAQRLTSARTGN
jgi:hypothetical protein